LNTEKYPPEINAGSSQVIRKFRHPLAAIELLYVGLFGYKTAHLINLNHGKTSYAWKSAFILI
jgi:hypothetical protein